MKERFVSLALLAAIIGIAPAFAQVSVDAAGISNNDNLIADGMIEQHQCRRVIKKCHKARVSAPKKETVSQTTTTTTQTIEKPAVVQQPQQIVEPAQEVTQPAVVASQPVIIDRFERRHRSLIHLGLFPFSLFGQ